MIEAALTYPTDREDWIKTVLIGGVLSFFGFLVLPLFAVYGYVVRVIRTSIAGETEPPAFDDWGSLLIDGLQAFVIGLVFMIVPAVVGMATVGGSLAAFASGSEVGAGLGVVGLFGGLMLTFVLTVVFGYLAAAAIVSFAHAGRFGAAFDVQRLRAVVLTTEFGIAWLIAVVALLVAGVIAGIPFIGFILGPFVGFYAAVVAGRLLAGGYTDVVGGGSAGPDAAGADQTA